MKVTFFSRACGQPGVLSAVRLFAIGGALVVEAAGVGCLLAAEGWLTDRLMYDDSVFF